MVDDSNFKSSRVTSNSQAEENDLHHGQRKDEQHHAHVTPHPQEILLQQSADLTTRCELQIEKNCDHRPLTRAPRSLTLQIFTPQSSHSMADWD